MLTGKAGQDSQQGLAMLVSDDADEDENTSCDMINDFC